MYPENDSQFEDLTITSTKLEDYGLWVVGLSNGFSTFIDADLVSAEPAPGMAIRLYHKGIGSGIRGVFLDGQKVYYRTEEEHQTYLNAKLYGRDAADWLARWDNGERVWSISMGGLGPAYEQAIQITTTEVLRWMLKNGYDYDQPEGLRSLEAWSHEDPIIKKLRLSGAQWGAAVNLAFNLYRRGPIAVFTDEELPRDRQIMVQRYFPNPYDWPEKRIEELEGHRKAVAEIINRLDKSPATKDLAWEIAHAMDYNM